MKRDNQTELLKQWANKEINAHQLLRRIEKLNNNNGERK